MVVKFYTSIIASRSECESRFDLKFPKKPIQPTRTICYHFPFIWAAFSSASSLSTPFMFPIHSPVIHLPAKNKDARSSAATKRKKTNPGNLFSSGRQAKKKAD